LGKNASLKSIGFQERAPKDFAEKETAARMAVRHGGGSNQIEGALGEEQSQHNRNSDLTASGVAVVDQGLVIAFLPSPAAARSFLMKGRR
jgi:hypothetical protein